MESRVCQGEFCLRAARSTHRPRVCGVWQWCGAEEGCRSYHGGFRIV